MWRGQGSFRGLRQQAYIPISSAVLTTSLCAVTLEWLHGGTHGARAGGAADGVDLRVSCANEK